MKGTGSTPNATPDKKGEAMYTHSGNNHSGLVGLSGWLTLGMFLMAGVFYLFTLLNCATDTKSQECPLAGSVKYNKAELREILGETGMNRVSKRRR